MTRGEIWLADFGIPVGSEPEFRRPVLIVQDDAFNRSKIRTVAVVPFSTNLDLQHAPGNVFLERSVTGLAKDSVVVVSQVTVLDRTRLVAHLSKLSRTNLTEIEAGLRLVLSL